MDQGTVDVLGTVETIRSQRAHSKLLSCYITRLIQPDFMFLFPFLGIQVPEQYVFCHAAVLEFSRAQNLITDEQLEGVPDLLQEGDSDSE